jgi:hypothetical protein
MGKMFFSGIREAVRAFKGEPPVELNEQERAAFEALRKEDGEGTGLGYRKRGAPVSAVEIKKHMAERGQNLPDASAEKIARSGRAQADAAARQRFIMQCAISLLILVAALWTIMGTSPQPATEKAMFGLIGTVLGYWLR